MFDFGSLFSAIRKHWAAFLVLAIVLVVFASAPFLALWRMAKRVPVAGDLLAKVPGQKA